MDVQQLLCRVSEIDWYHSIDLGHGIVTPGLVDDQQRLSKIALPDDLSGKTVLDIGAWDGFFSFAAERRGAARVLAVDSHSWNGSGWGSKAGFTLAREVLNSRVEDREMEVLDLSPSLIGTFDVVLCLGVLYHMRHPLLMLEAVASVTAECLILETLVDGLNHPRPTLTFYPGKECNGDDTNWWGPNPAALIAMLHEVGFQQVDVVSPPDSLPKRWVRTLGHSLRQQKACWHERHQSRIVVHAWKKPPQ